MPNKEHINSFTPRHPIIINLVAIPDQPQIAHRESNPCTVVDHEDDDDNDDDDDDDDDDDVYQGVDDVAGGDDAAV